MEVVMRRLFKVLLLAVISVIPVSLLAQQVAHAPATPAVRDAQAITVLSQSLAAVAGPQGMTSVRDFSGSGTITYFWAPQPVSGPAEVRGRGFDQFRLDSNLPTGARSYSVSHGVGVLREANGEISEIPLHNT